jgi:hypothetical protein
MDPLVRDTPVEPTPRDHISYRVAAAYGSGYTDGITLLHVNGHNRFSLEPLQIVHDRYLCNVQIENSTPEADAYIAGFNDVAADNLRSPPRGI